MENTKSLIALNIRRLRHDLNMTQAELAEKADMSLRGVQDIETGKNAPRAITLKQIAKALGVSEAILYADPHKPAPVEKSQKRMDAIAWELNLDIEDPADKEFLKQIIPILPELKKVPVEILDLLTKADSHTHAHILEELRLLNEPDPPNPKGTKKSKDLGR